MVTLLYPQMSEIGTVGVAGRERMVEIDIKKKISQPWFMVLHE